MRILKLYIIFSILIQVQTVKAQEVDNLVILNHLAINKSIFGSRIGFWKTYDSSEKSTKFNFYIYDTVLLKLNFIESGLLEINIDSLLKSNNFCSELCSYQQKFETVYNSENILDTIIVEVDIPILELDSTRKIISKIENCTYQSKSPKIIEYYQNGSPAHVLVFNNGINQKSIFEYWDNKKLKNEKHFKNDEPIGTWLIYNQEGKLIEKKQY